MILELFGVKDFCPYSSIFEKLGFGCNYFPFICDDFLFLIVGWDRGDFNDSRFPVILSHTPAGTSVQNMVHWAQMDRDDAFAMFDYGYDGNMQHYNQSTPPKYYLSNIKIPVALIYGSEDALTDPTDVQRTQSELSNVVYANEIQGFNHLDYVWDVNAAYTLYPDLLKLLDSY